MVHHAGFHRTLPLLLLIALPGCGKGPTPVAAEKPKVESDLAYVTLTKKQVAALRIESRPIVPQSVQEHLPLTGWIMAKQGHEVTLTAPVAGYIRAPEKPQQLPVAGHRVSENQELWSLMPVLSPHERVQMDSLRRSVASEVVKAKATKELVALELTITEDLFKQEIKKQQDLMQAKVRLEHAIEDLSAAEFKMKLFDDGPRPIRAPRAGVVATVHVSPGQYVPVSAPLVTLIDLSTLWVRVPVPEQDLLEVERDRATTVALRSNNANSTQQKQANRGKHLHAATYVAAVPQVDAARHTADLIYEMQPFSSQTYVRFAASAVGDLAQPLAPSLLPVVRAWLSSPSFAKDQMVTVFVPMGPRRTGSVVPYSAIVYDSHGGTWVYLDRTNPKDETHRYERRRVELSFPVAEGMVIRPSLAAEDRVVTSGAGVLFSREFHHAGVKHEDLDDD